MIQGSRPARSGSRAANCCGGALSNAMSTASHPCNCDWWLQPGGPLGGFDRKHCYVQCYYHCHASNSIPWMGGGGGCRGSWRHESCCSQLQLHAKGGKLVGKDTKDTYRVQQWAETYSLIGGGLTMVAS